MAMAHSCASCRETLSAIRSVGGGPSQALADRHSNLSARCPGLLAALGSRTTPQGAGGKAHRTACNLPPSILSLDDARALPRVYVYSFMDALHDHLVRLPSSEHIFDPWHQQNQARASCATLCSRLSEPRTSRVAPIVQFLSEYAFHRSLLASSLVTADPTRASLYFVPFYSRMAFSNRSIKALMLSTLEAGLGASPFWRRSRGRDHAFVVSSTRPMEQLYGAQVTCGSRLMPRGAARLLCRRTSAPHSVQSANPICTSSRSSHSLARAPLPPAAAPVRSHPAQDRARRPSAQVERPPTQPRRVAVLRAVAPAGRDEYVTYVTYVTYAT